MKFFFLGISLLLFPGLLIIWGLLLWSGLVLGAVFAMLIGTFLAWFFVSSGFISFYYARNKPTRSFGKIFLFSIFGRLTALAVILIVLLKYTGIIHPPFLISLLIWYFIFQIWEAISFNRLEIGKS